MEGYGMFTSCEKIPRRRCYEPPRQVRTEVCQPDHSRFCQKVTNEHPEPPEAELPLRAQEGVRAAEAHKEQEGQEVQLQPGLPARGQEHLRAAEADEEQEGQEVQ